jgi:hypothetical protein
LAVADVAPAPTEAPAPTPATVSLSQTIDQSLKGTAARLSLGELQACRVHFEAVTGAAPAERYLPTSDQLAALRAVLAQGLPPYADFAVWSAMGPRLAKFQRTEAAVLIGGAFVTKVLEAPSSYAAWEDSWLLFSTAMVSVNAARPGSLNAYHEGIKTLLRHFPTRWSTLVASDLVVRSERWSRMLEEIVRSPPLDFDAAAPWDWIIAASAYGRSGPLASWWANEVVLPLSLGSSSPFAGLPGGGSTSASSSQRSTRQPAQKRAHPGGTRSAGGGSGGPDVSRQVCHDFNASRGACAGDGPCPNGRRHVCLTCPPYPGATHRASQVHGGSRGRKHRSSKGGKGTGKNGGSPPAPTQ